MSKWCAGLVTTNIIWRKKGCIKRQHSVTASYQHFLWISLLILVNQFKFEIAKVVNINFNIFLIFQ